MKALIKFLILASITAGWANSQWVTAPLPFSSSLDNMYVRDVSYPNADIGYVAALIVAKIGMEESIFLYKTTNKGQNWYQVEHNLQNESPNGTPVVFFINTVTGYLVTNTGDCKNTCFTIYKTTNGGSNWFFKSSFYFPTQGCVSEFFNRFLFLNESTGYLWHIYGLHKTTDGGNTWTEIFNRTIGNNFSVLNDVEVSKLNNNVLYVGGEKNNYPVLYKSENAGQSFSAICDGSSNPNNVYGINSISLNDVDVLYASANGGVAKLTGNQLNVLSMPYNTSIFKHKDIVCLSDNSCVLYAERIDLGNGETYIGRSTNGGYNWILNEYTAPSSLLVQRFSVNGDVVHAAAFDNLYSNPNGFVLTEKIPIHGQLAFDLVPNPNYNSHFTIYDWLESATLNIPGSLNVLGGSLNAEIDVNDKILENGNKIFYRWQTSMNTGYPYIDRTENYITANYKSKLKSTVPNSIAPVSQTKAIKDTNGVINLIYESMGGIFYTRSTDGGNTFSMEEIVNYHETEFSGMDNYNPCLAEIKPFWLQEPPAAGSENMAAVWERKENSSIIIRFSERKNTNPPLNPLNWTRPINLLTIDNVPSGFESKPKLFMSKRNNNDDSIVALLYLKPVNGNNQLWCYGRNRITYQFYNICIIGGSNISSFSATGLMQNYNGNCINIHIVYVQDGHIKYKHGYLESNHDLGVNWSEPYLSEDYTISNLDILQNRGEPDITLRNKSDIPNEFDMQPVVTFKGQQTVIINIQQGDGNPTQQNYTYYAIVVRERLSNSTWGNNFWYYNTVVKQSPNIEGAKKKNAYILNYKYGSLYLQKVLKWSTNSGYFCDPGYFSGIDAKFVRGGLIDLSSTQQRLVGLSGSSSPYQVSIEPSNITTTPSNPDNPIHEIRGTVINDNIKYSFNLGSITVNSEMIDFGDDIDTSIGGGEELNENLISKPFLLNDNDTLIIGRNASYLDQGGGDFTEVQYAVYLTKNSSGEKFLELARDTVHAGDSIQIEYLEGFIIQNIPNGSDSFYVQMEIDTVWAGGGDDFGMNNISNDVGGEGDNTAMKKYVFWKNANVVTNNIPTAFNLYQNFPNPFNPLTKIKYDLPKNVNVTVKVYDLLGREVAILVNNEFKTAGRYEINWDAMNFASGVYIYRIQAGDYISTKKMVLVK